MDFLRPIVYGGYLVLQTYLYILLITIILGWTPLTSTRFYEFLRKISSPFLNLFQGWIVISNIDFTPIFGFVLYNLILQGLESILF